MRVAAALLAAALAACGPRLQPVVVAGVEAALPPWPGQSENDDPSSGSMERADGKGSRAGVRWDVDPRPGRVSEETARAAAGLPDGEATAAQVEGHGAVLLRGRAGAAMVWRCGPTARLFRAFVAGPRSPEIASLAAHARCHANPILTMGDVPALATAALGPGWSFASRARGSISYLGEDEVLTLFAGQAVPPLRGADAARSAAPGWLAAAGLAEARSRSAAEAPGPQAHPGLEVDGEARLDGRPVRFRLLFWRCPERQKTFAAVVFGQRDPSGAPLLAARCHA